MDLFRHVMCINLKRRKDRRDHMKKLFQKWNITASFFQAIENSEKPDEGCFQSHLAVIRHAKEKNWPYVLVLEDDITFLQNPKKYSPPPENWQMLYLGGNVRRIHTPHAKITSMAWKKVESLSGYAYLVRDTLYDALLQKAFCPIDVFYLTYLHTVYQCYMIFPQIAHPIDTYSDLMRTNVSYNYLLERDYSSPYWASSDDVFLKSDFEMARCSWKNDQCTLKLPYIHPKNLPSVSIITPTYKRQSFFQLPIFCWQHFDYPKDQMEWIVIEDGDETVQKMLENLVPHDDIQYVRIQKHITLGMKRNIGCKMAKYDIVIHMDDDDYYPPESIMARVKTLVAYPHFQCVGCSQINSHDLVSNQSFISYDPGSCGQPCTLGEASMAYTKTFWQERNWNNEDTRQEIVHFIKNRKQLVMEVPSQFVICALSHTKNTTETRHMMSLVQRGTFKNVKFSSTWPESIQNLVKSIRYKFLHGIKIIGLYDTNFAGQFCSCPGKKPTHFQFERNVCGKEMTVFTDFSMFEDSVKTCTSPIKIGWLLEPRSIYPECYNRIEEIFPHMTYILTHEMELVRNDPEHFYYAPAGNCFLRSSVWEIHTKIKNVSMVYSSKQMTEGHQLRHQIAGKYAHLIDLYGSGTGHHLVNKDIAYIPYRFQVVVENICIEGYFTEKLIDCFKTGVVPIYWVKDDSIEQFFEKDGMILFHTLDELDKILHNLTHLSEKIYEEKKEHIHKNFQLASQYTIAEDWIFDNHLCQLFVEKT